MPCVTVLGYRISIVKRIDDEFISVRKNLSYELVFMIEMVQDHLTLTSELKLSTSLDPSGETGLSLKESYSGSQESHS